MTTHHFQPERYYNTMGEHEPVLKIADGDTVVTSTVDARGWDYKGESAATRGNPMTGPFYVEGAQPGDTLAILFESITPNRDWGWTRDILAPNVVDPYVAAELPLYELTRWTVNAQQDSIVLE